MAIVDPLVWHDKRQPTPTWVPDNYGEYWQNGPRRYCAVCTLSGIEGHPPVPPWYTNAVYSLRSGATYWQHAVKGNGFHEMIARRLAFLQDFSGPCGTFWCGNCFQHVCFLRLGELLEYPDACQFYQLTNMCNMAGYVCWLWLARFAGSVYVETVLTQAQATGIDIERVALSIEQGVSLSALVK